MSGNEINYVESHVVTGAAILGPRIPEPDNEPFGAYLWGGGLSPKKAHLPILKDFRYVKTRSTRRLSFVPTNGNKSA